MAKIISSTKDLSREDWLKLRQLGIGGSDAAIVLGLSKWKTPFELFLEKTNQVELQESQSEAAYFGSLLEDVVAKEFELRTGKKVRRRNQMLQHDEHEFMLANVDRMIVGEDAILECKTASAYLANDWKDDEVPENYIIQVQHYMAVTDTKKAYIAALIGGNRFIWKEIERDDELIEIIINAQKEFWNEFVKKDIPPALDGSSAAERYIKERYLQAETETVVDLSHEYISKIESLNTLKEQSKFIDTQIKEIENQIKNEMKTSSLAAVGNYQIKWNNVTSNRLDSKALKEKHPAIYEEFTKSSISRRFAIKEI